MENEELESNSENSFFVGMDEYYNQLDKLTTDELYKLHQCDESDTN